MSRAEQIAEKAARFRTSVPTEVRASVGTEVSGSVPTALSRSVPRAKPVRLTVDLAPSTYSDWAQLLVDLAAEVGVAKIPGQDVLRSLIRQALADPQTRAQLVRNLTLDRQ